MPVQLGVIGCGVIGQHHLRAARDWPSIRLAAVADVRRDAAEQAAAEHGVPRAFDSGEALLRDAAVEAVVLALPAGLRGPLALAAVAAGKHVLLEKPPAMHAGELRELAAARQTARTSRGGAPVVACCSSRMRFLPSARAASEFIATGALGPIRLLRARGVSPAGEPPRMPPPAWRLSRRLNGGGILANWGSYDLDYLLGLTGWAFRPRVVLAQCWGLPPQLAGHVAAGSDAETHVAALVRGQIDGAAATLTIERGEYLTTAKDAAWQIIGQRGSLRLNMVPAAGVALMHDEADPQRGLVSRELFAGPEDLGAIHAGPVRDFADAIEHGREPLTGLNEALLLQQVMDAIWASAQRGRAVEL